MKEAIKDVALQVAKIGSGVYLKEDYPPTKALDILIQLDQIAMQLLMLADKIPA